MAVFVVSMVALFPSVLPEAHAGSGVLTIINEFTCETISADWTGPDTCTLNADYQNQFGTTLTIGSGIIFDTDAFWFNNTAFLINNGTLNNNNSTIIKGSGTFVNNSIVNNFLNFNVTDTATATNNGSFVNTGNLDNDNDFFINGNFVGTGGDTSDGSEFIQLAETITNDVTLTDAGTVEVDDADTTIEDGSTLTIGDGSEVEVLTGFEIINDGNLANNSSPTLDINGDLTNNNVMTKTLVILIFVRLVFSLTMVNLQTLVLYLTMVISH